ncbi:multiple epidermal growth factor-like domains protein 6 isoform X4 [Saccostrea cucullata]|uniref:multiple epidermal growth factor-like domains protein 6 isoform X4 n=1 Tax=Saccostrea cuccullata TaxID=36930 RepID=UPI002ED368EC
MMTNMWCMLFISIVWANFSTINSVRVCEPGTFGWHCKFSCYCAEGSCDPITGTCPSGCQRNRYGPGCQLLSAFRYSVEAHGYQGSTDRTADGEKCVMWNNTVFVVMYGLKSSDFPDQAIPGAFCRNPLNLIFRGLEGRGPWCFTNFMEKTKFYGSCDIPVRGCDSGRFGELCEFECHCKYESPCTPMGICPSGCHPGWLKSTCQTLHQISQLRNSTLSEIINYTHELTVPRTSTLPESVNYSKIHCPFFYTNNWYMQSELKGSR